MHQISSGYSLYGALVSVHRHDSEAYQALTSSISVLSVFGSMVRSCGISGSKQLSRFFVSVAGFILMGLPFGAGAAEEDAIEPAETFNATVQTTWIVAEHSPFRAAYTGTNSLNPIHEKAYTWTVTAYLGYRPFTNTEIYFNPEMIQSNQFSGLHGLGAFNNNENQKMGEITPTFYRARLFARQTWNLGGEKIMQESGANQLAGSIDANRFVLTVGNISTPDIFDNNAYAHDARTQFLNWALFTHIASDFAADGRGYTWGLAGEYYRDNWVYRLGAFTQPKESNGLYLEHSITRHAAIQAEVEHAHELYGQPGKLRLFAFRNHASMGNFREALAYSNLNVGTPDLANVRHDQNKTGAGINVEQSLGKNIGLFGRIGFNNGQTETYQFAEADRSISGGIVIKGGFWGRKKDTLGLALAKNDISGAHRAYLAAGGLGAFIGDGQLPNYRSEKLIETYYNVALHSHASLAVDFQRIANPAYNADRGPVNIYAMRLHVEY